MARQPSDPEQLSAGKPQPAEKEIADKSGAGTRKRLVTGAAIGIGSAALVAALLYANRARRTDKGS